jgi:hypothetical protein
MFLPNDERDALAAEHRRWLGEFNAQYLTNWEKLYRDDEEAALCEAAVRRLLMQHDVQVEPNERLTGNCGGPDFRCTVDGRHFYVEVKCITTETAIQMMKVGEGTYDPQGMVQPVFSTCVEKARQVADQDAPVLLAVGSFSDWADVGFEKAANSVLTGIVGLTWDINIETGEASDTHQTTTGRFASFLRPDSAEEIGFARESVSGVLLCVLHPSVMRTLGVLHPNPVRPFNPELLRGIEFGRVEIDRQSRKLHVRWPHGNDDA